MPWWVIILVLFLILQSYGLRTLLLLALSTAAMCVVGLIVGLIVIHLLPPLSPALGPLVGLSCGITFFITFLLAQKCLHLIHWSPLR